MFIKLIVSLHFSAKVTILCENFFIVGVKLKNYTYLCGINYYIMTKIEINTVHSTQATLLNREENTLLKRFLFISCPAQKGR